jgi:hypothetical protein
MPRSLGIISGAFALRSEPFALVGHLVFLFFERHFLLNPISPIDPPRRIVSIPMVMMRFAPLVLEKARQLISPPKWCSRAKRYNKSSIGKFAAIWIAL